MKNILIIALGGTISAQGRHRTDLKDYKSGMLTGDDFIAKLPELNEVGRVSIEQFDNISSTAINPDHWIKLRNRVTQALNNEHFDGIVITHGTNTLEETAYFLHLTVPSEKPIVFVGAQRPFTALSSDAQLNLINAVRVATSDKSYGKGVLVVLNNIINCAREVTKIDTYQVGAFQSGQFGALGSVENDQTIQFYRTSSRKHTMNSDFSTLPIQYLPSIEIIYSYAGATGELINYVTASGKYDGIIMAGTGAGRFSPMEDEALNQAIQKGLTVVRSSRVGNGRVIDIDHYQTMSVITGDNLLPQKARILLMLTLLIHQNRNDIQRFFDQY